MQFALRLPHIGLHRGLLVPLRCGFRTLVLRRGLLLPLRCGFRTLVLRAAFYCRCAAASAHWFCARPSIAVALRLRRLDVRRGSASPAC